MPLIIDCYNVLHADKPMPLAGLGEASLCSLLMDSPWARGGVTVVCDGAPKPHSPDPRDVEPVELLFSGAGRSADDVIIGLIDVASAPRRLTVVSSDRTIRKAARRRRARDVTAEAFLEKLAHVLRQGGASGAIAPGKPSIGPLPDNHVERWLDWFGIDADNTSGSGSPPTDPYGLADMDLADIADLDDLDDLKDL